jgi:succinoglycan biosynthesis protein ExoM
MGTLAAPFRVTVCIPTYRRPALLRRCLLEAGRQETDGFAYNIVVVDNDRDESARTVVEGLRLRLSVEIAYHVEPVQSISLTRNRAVAASDGELIAFMDDDEFPGPTWLVELVGAYQRYGADGVLGPVVPFYSVKPPRWLQKSGLCDRATFPTGTLLRNSRYLRTGNVLLARRLFDPGEQPFAPSFGLTGGEDVDFFERMLRRGRSFVWCQEAPVHEEVPGERQRRMYFVRRALLRGVVRAGSEPFFSLRTAKSLAGVILYSFSLPFLMLAGEHLFMRYLVKDCDLAAKLLAHCGIRLARKRSF